uniref:Secreted protein n=1 Tax=Globodera pallida TaxID=36090 RepID=A0A183C922_GLOPA
MVNKQYSANFWLFIATSTLAIALLGLKVSNAIESRKSVRYLLLRREYLRLHPLRMIQIVQFVVDMLMAQFAFTNLKCRCMSFTPPISVQPIINRSPPILFHT